MGQSIYRALALRDFGERLEVHFGNSDELAAGRYFTSERAPVVAGPVLPLAAAPEYLETVRAYVAEHEIDVVFAGTQHELVELARLRDEGGRVATVGSGLARLTLDKRRLVEALGAAGLAVPATRPLDAYLSGREPAGDVVIKPRTSSSSRSVFHVRADDDARLEHVVREIGPDAVDRFVVQERLVGDEYTCGCYRDRYSAEIAVIVLRRLLTPDGATGFGECVDAPEIELYVQAVAQALVGEGFDFGHVNVQLVLTERGPVLFEVNGRLSSTEAPKAVLGFNSSAAYVDNLVFERAAALGPVATGTRFLRFYDEVYF